VSGEFREHSTGLILIVRFVQALEEVVELVERRTGE